MPGAVVSYGSPLLPAAEEGNSRIRLRLHFRGAFSRASESQTWRYAGGEVFNESIPVTYKYADLCRKLNDKFGDTVSFKYQAPGEELDPEGLVAVTDDDDLQELYEEYFQALNRPGTPQKTFRIRVFVFPALQFETLYNLEDDCAEEMETSGSGKINFESWCSDEASACSNLSGNPSSDTEMDYAGRRPSASLQYQTLAQLDQQQRPQQQQQQDASRGRCALTLAATGLCGSQLPPGISVCPPVIMEEGMAMQGLQNVHQALSGFQIAAENFGLDDPYHEQDDDSGCAQMAKLHQQNLQQQQQQPPWDPAPKLGQGDIDGSEPGKPLSMMPLSRVREVFGGNNLPSHISIFGDYLGESVSGGGDRNNSLRLPSHISAFGDGFDFPECGDALCTLLREGRSCPGTGHGLGSQTPVSEEGEADLVLPKRHHSKVITQEFSSPAYDEEDGLAGADGGGCNGQGAGGMLLNLDEPPGCRDMHSPRSLNFQLDRGPESATGPSLHSQPNLLEVVVRVSREAVKTVAKIGEGAFGDVSQAIVFPYGSVAIKWLKRERFAKYLDSFQREAEVLAKLNHPNIIRMYGLVTEPATGQSSGVGSGGSGLSSGTSSTTNGSGSDATDGGATLIAGIMTEFVRGGSLSQYLRNVRDQSRRLSLKERCQIAWHATLGMAYLHDQSPAIIHFDLKPDNLLVEGEGDNLLVKVADFGLSKHKFQSYVSCRDLRGTLPYMAPELVNNPNQVCEKCDVWSMGVVMWELFTLEVPFQELSAQQILVGLMNGSLHLAVPPCCEPEWRWLVEWCMEVHPTKRPSFMQLATKLEAILRQL